MKEKIEAALDKIRPALREDGGDVEFVDVKESIVTVRLTGHCGGCPMSTMTLQRGVERVIREDVPEITKVVAV